MFDTYDSSPANPGPDLVISDPRRRRRHYQILPLPKVPDDMPLMDEVGRLTPSQPPNGKDAKQPDSPPAGGLLDSIKGIPPLYLYGGLAVAAYFLFVKK